MHQFGRNYWEDHWKDASAHAAPAGSPLEQANPHVIRHTAHLTPTTALDAGCGTGIEALWLAEQGWEVTGADISRTALTTAAQREQLLSPARAVEWVETDVSRWTPHRTWDLVVTHYAHPDIGQLEFYRHIASFVAPGGTLLIAAHARGGAQHHHHPEAATVDPEEVADLFSPLTWEVEARATQVRTAGGAILHDVVIRIRRLS